MIEDFKIFFSRIRKVDFSTFGGIEIVIFKNGDIIFEINHWRDLCSFWIHDRYTKQFGFKAIFGAVRHFYTPVKNYRPEAGGTFYFLWPVALWVYAGRYARIAWFWPLRVLIGLGYAKIPEGERAGVFWLKYLTL